MVSAEGENEMIVIFRRQATKGQIDTFLNQLEEMGYSHHYSQGENSTICGIIGDTSKLDTDYLRANDVVEDVKRVSEPYKLANRKFHPADSVYNIFGRTVGA